MIFIKIQLKKTLSCAISYCSSLSRTYINVNFSTRATHSNYKSKGFTLIELLLVIAIVAFIAAIIISAISSTREKARDAKRVADLNQIAKAIEFYMNDNNGVPPGTDGQEYENGLPDWIPGLSPNYLRIVPSDPIDINPFIYHYKRQGFNYETAARLERRDNPAARNDGGPGGQKFYETGSKNNIITTTGSGPTGGTWGGSGLTVSVTSIFPSSGNNSGSVSISTIEGTEFAAFGTVTVKLIRTGYPDIVGTGFTRISSTTISGGSFNLIGVASGQWDVVVIDSSLTGQPSGSLDNGFTVLSGPDTDSPTLSITSPVNGANISATININSADAADNIGVIKVEFKLDATPTSEIRIFDDTSPAWSAVWDTTTATNGSHTLVAVANDTAGNRATSSVVTVTVNNIAPVVATDPATNISSSGADLNGTANPNNFSTLGWFRHSTTNPVTCNNTFGTRIPLGGGSSLGAGNASTSYSQSITGLGASTLYYFCANASSSIGVGLGNTVRSFTTLAATSPPTVTTNAASSITASDATLNSSINPNNLSTTAWFRYSTTNPGTCNDTFGTKVPATGGTTLTGGTVQPDSRALTGLTVDTTYYFCAIASNSSGTTLGNVLSFTTTAGSLTVDISANPASGAEPLSSDISGTVTGGSGTINYSFWWNCNDPTTSVATAQTSCGSLPAPVAGTCQTNTTGAKCDAMTPTSQLVNNVYSTAGTYNAKVIGERGAATPGEMRTTITVTAATDTTAPTTPTGFNATAVSSSQINLSWTASTDNVAVTGYKVYRCTGAACTPSVLLTTLGVVTNYSNTGLTASTEYGYKVSAIDAAGNESSLSATASATTQAAAPTPFSMQTGYYVGTGASLSITGLGFQPQLVIIKSDTAAGSAVWKSSAMPAANTTFFTATADNATTQVTLNADGFTVGTLANVNSANVRYIWTAFANSNCSSTGTICVGSYTGDGASNKSITSVGFQPDLIWVKGSGATSANWRSSAMPNNIGQYFEATAENTSGSLYTTLDMNGFTVGLTNNTSGTVYQFVAVRNSAGIMNVGSYTGSGVDNSNITGVGFIPNFTFIKSAIASSSVFNITETFGDYSSFFTTNANSANNIQLFQTDGLQIGSSVNVNRSATTYYWAAFAGALDPVPSGTFTMATGSYTGTGVANTNMVSGLAFAPDLVIIKNASQATNQYAVFRTKMIGGDSTAYFSNASGNFTLAITSLNSDGFGVGTHATVNTSGSTYYWEAFGNAFDPMTQTGAADFAIGAYQGNAIDNRNITRMGFQPNLVTVKSGSNVGVWRTSSILGDLATFFGATANVANYIQALNSDGFQVGTASGANTAATIHWWFAFKTGSNFTVGSYVGNAGTNDITSLSFSPDLVWTKQTGAVNGVHRASSLTGDSTQYFANLANVTGRIISLLANGFSVTGSATESNASGVTYYYAAWNANP